ncbi:uncharacterized protein LAJ45_07396 [Morchella importuna]|uniref:uncharacterized protein n=1 Tax=Morchella sextelata TaxID=1174677 RepID=UPI001D038376|nr:uncharacterized protein H6S33_007412 [Morchella sextelata]XP_045969989.1 uncharacterized protein LAJ45_07396 [Morchella importuna]KAH0603753.1 hypothetical protein H6S33_007412 [Morchella sextelata]KAH8148685.1 hypothetical protein LAJ45_07396 [Morchella importuna]
MSSKVAAPKSSDPKDDKPTQKPNVSLEEDDEFEDFPVEDWEDAEADVPGGKGNLWEESWDDDDTSEDFSAQLREELKKTGANKS